MCSLILSDHRPLVETYYKWAPQLSFEVSVKSWILWSLGWRSTLFITFAGFALGELKWSLTKEGGFPMTEDISSAPWWNWKGLMWRRPSGTILSIETSNPIATSNILQSKKFTRLRIKSCRLSHLSDGVLQGLNLSSSSSPRTETLSRFEFGGWGSGRLPGPSTTPIPLVSEGPRWVLEFPFEPFYR